MTASSASPSKTRTSFYRRLYVAWLIEQRVATVPAIMSLSGMPRRTVQDTISALHELDIQCQFQQRDGKPQNQGAYVIKAWGAINRDWVTQHIDDIARLLAYPVPELQR